MGRPQQAAPHLDVLAVRALRKQADAQLCRGRWMTEHKTFTECLRQKLLLVSSASPVFPTSSILPEKRAHVEQPAVQYLQEHTTKHMRWKVNGPAWQAVVHSALTFRHS